MTSKLKQAILETKIFDRNVDYVVNHKIELKDFKSYYSGTLSSLTPRVARTFGARIFESLLLMLDKLFRMYYSLTDAKLTDKECY